MYNSIYELYMFFKEPNLSLYVSVKFKKIQ